MTDKKYTVGVGVGCGGAIAVLDTDFNYIDHLLSRQVKARVLMVLL